MITLDDTKTRIILAAIKAVRQYGLEGVRIQNVSELAGISSGAIYRHFDGKEQLLAECFTYVDRQAAAIFEHLKFNPLVMLTDPMKAVKGLWLPYFRFWTSHPDETGCCLFQRIHWNGSCVQKGISKPRQNQSGLVMAPCPHIDCYVCKICGRGSIAK